MDNLKFRVSAELKNILGKDLITSPNIAILELVKNSYDAHATKVEITFEEDCLVVADNGKGMTLDDLINKWLFVAYSAKSDGTEDQSYRSKFKRHYAGAKGIGRMSCDRLAQNLTLITKNENGNIEQLNVDWNSFDHNAQRQFESIDIPHQTLTREPKFPEDSPTGTILEFRNLRDNWQWTEERIKQLRSSLEKMINPFSGTDDFHIEITSSFSHLNGLIKNTVADVIKLKTTQIECKLLGNTIKTTLIDRGTIMYEIEETGKYDCLQEVSISLLYLNRAAKYNFTSHMGVEPVNYGNVFLFRNGIRIWPYGEWDDDSWRLNQRAQQGYNRFLGTRDLFGRVDVETDNVADFKEVSSRDGGLIETDASKQMFQLFETTHRRLERYVVGVLWGEGFIRRDYFVNEELALTARKKIQESDKYSESADHVYKNIGSRVDFLQLVRSLVNDSSIDVKYYNEDLANVVANVSDTEIIQTQVIDDFRKLAQKTNDAKMLSTIDEFERQMEQLRKEKEEAERKAEEERKRAEEEKRKREQAEKELEQKRKQNLFLQSIGSLDVDRILKYHHDIRIHAATVKNSIGKILKKAYQKKLTSDDVVENIERVSRANDKIISIAQFATKANFNVDADEIEEDIITYIEQYVSGVLPDFYDECTLSCTTNACHKKLKFNPLEVSLLIDNLVGNSIKAGAKRFHVLFEQYNGFIIMNVMDDGRGLNEDITDASIIFEKGYTTTNGSGLGLYNIACYVRETLKGSIRVGDKHIRDNKGFCLEITI